MRTTAIWCAAVLLYMPGMTPSVSVESVTMAQMYVRDMLGGLPAWP